MKKSLLTLSMVALCALTACAGGTKVTAEKFAEEAGKVEAQEHASATIKYKVMIFSFFNNSFLFVYILLC